MGEERCKQTLEGALKEAYDCTHRLLFSRFCPKVWVIISLLGLITGASWTLLSSPFPSPGFLALEPSAPTEDHSQCAWSDHCLVTGEPKQTTEPQNEITLQTLITANLIGAILVGSIFMAYIASRLTFVFLEIVASAQQSLQIKKPWKRYKTQGNSLFLWSFVFLLALVPVFACLFYGIYLTGAEQELLGVGLILGTSLMLAGVITCYLLIVDFCFPIMAIDDVGLPRSVLTLVKIIAKAPLKFLMYLPLAIIVGIFISVAYYIACLIPIAATILVGYATLIPLEVILGISSANLDFLYSIVVFVVVAPTVLAIITLTVPGIVYYRAFSLKYLGYMDQNYIWESYQEETPTQKESLPPALPNETLPPPLPSLKSKES